MFENWYKHHEQRRALSEIRLQAGGAADVIIDRINNGEAPPYRFRVPKPPHSLPAEVFSQRVGEAAITRVLQEIPVGLRIEYDHEASCQATGEFPALQPDQPTPSHAQEGIVLVFSKSRALD